jgi:hypothetical protein
MIKFKLLSVVAILSSAIATPALAQTISQVHGASMSARAQTRTHESGARPQSYGIGGREVAAPAWSAACMTDHGPSECGQPMWIYGSSGVPARYRDAF